MTSGVKVSVAGTKDFLVGGKVAVTKSGPTAVAESESTATEIQDDSRLVNNSVK
jgi:hypothetical protein